MEKARGALHQAYARYSHFRVGAAIQTPDGQQYSGCNIEISSYGLTVCAERVAIFKAISEGKRAFEVIAIAAETEDFCPPCGACRQVLADFAPDLRIILINKKGQTKETTLTHLLPEAFNPDFLDTHE